MAFTQLPQQCPSSDFGGLMAQLVIQQTPAAVLGPAQGQGQPVLPNWASCSLVCCFMRSLHSPEEEAALCPIGSASASLQRCVCSWRNGRAPNR